MEFVIGCNTGYRKVSYGLIKSLGFAQAVAYSYLRYNDPGTLTASDLQLQELRTSEEEIRRMIGPDDDGYYKIDSTPLKRTLGMSEETKQIALKRLLAMGLIELKGSVEQETFYVKVQEVKDLAEEGYELYIKEGHLNEIYEGI